MILIGNQAKILNKQNNKPMMMSTFGVLPTQYIRGTPAHKSSNTCVQDAGSNPHPEVVAAGYIKNGGVFTEVYLLQLCVNIQLFLLLYGKCEGTGSCGTSDNILLTTSRTCRGCG